MTTEMKDIQKQEARSVEGAAQRLEPRPVYVPATDIYERADAIVVLMDMPGASQQSVDVNLENDVLTIVGRVETVASEGYKVLYSECTPGDYRRAFSLSEDVDRDGIKAVMKNGVLQVTLPKKEKAKPKKIEIKTE